MNSANDHPIIVLGAGMSGLAAASLLSQSGFSPLVLDKARGVGGRMSRRRTEWGPIDHGASFFQARHPLFQKQVDAWLQQGLVFSWSRGFSDESGHRRESGVPCYACGEGMNAVLKDLARGLDIHTRQKVQRVCVVQDQWQLETEGGETYRTDALLMTAPVPQSLELLNQGKVSLDDAHRSALASIDYEPCLALMVVTSQKSPLPENGGLWLSGEPLSWIADQSRKTGSENAISRLVLHAGPDFSRAHWDEDPEKVTEEILKAADPWLAGERLSVQYHRWRYKTPLKVFPEPCLKAHAKPALFLAGDGFQRSGVEGAYLSGHAAAQALLS